MTGLFEFNAVAIVFAIGHGWPYVAMGVVGCNISKAG